MLSVLVNRRTCLRRAEVSRGRRQAFASTPRASSREPVKLLPDSRTRHWRRGKIEVARYIRSVYANETHYPVLLGIKERWWGW